MDRGKISVCMASYNGGLYIKDQLESILCQLESDDEIIISDDGSTDNTIDVINSFCDNRIKLFLSSFHNLNMNFEFSLKQATGDFIFLSDQDDIWLPNKVNIMLSALKEYDLVSSDCYVVNSKLDVISNSLYNSTKRNKKGFWNNFIKCNYIGCCMAFKKSILDKAIPFPKGLICHDVWIGLVAEAFGNPTFIDEQLIYYRRHQANASQTTIGSTLTLREKISYRFLMLSNIIKKYLNQWKPPVFAF